MNRITPIYHSFLFLMFFSAFALEAKQPMPIDSIGVEKVGDKTFILHKVTPKETLFGISRRYQVSIGEIQQANEVLKQGLKIGQTIRIPFVVKGALPEGVRIHKVSRGETLFSLSKTYNTSIDSLKIWNNLSGSDLSVGQSLKIKEVSVKPSAQSTSSVASIVIEHSKLQPVAETKNSGNLKSDQGLNNVEKSKKVTATATTSASTTSSNLVVPGDWKSHTVQSGETLFSLATQYEVSIENLIQWNALTSNNLRSGQVLKVGRNDTKPSTVTVIGTRKEVSSPGEITKETTYENTSGGFKNVKETGLAEVIEGTGTHKKYLVLHRSAPVGSIIRVKNEENDMTIFARVVGSLPDTGDNSKLVIKLSQAAFDQLKAVNPRFPVEILF